MVFPCPGQWIGLSPAPAPATRQPSGGRALYAGSLQCGSGYTRCLGRAKVAILWEIPLEMVCKYTKKVRNNMMNDGKEWMPKGNKNLGTDVREVQQIKDCVLRDGG
jgi:hypothetical protein